MMNEDVLLFVTIVVGLLVFGGGLFGFIYWTVSRSLKPVKTAANIFMTALKEEAYEQAYDTLLTRRFRDLTSPGAMSEQIRSQGQGIEQWRWGRVETTGDVGYLKGQITFADGESEQMRLTMSQIDHTWLVDDIEWGDPA